MYCSDKFKHFANQCRAGFALIEVITAVLILSVSFPIFYAILSQGAGSVIRMRDGIIAQAVAESTLNYILHNPGSPRACFSRYENCEISTVTSPEGMMLPADFDFKSLSVQTQPAENGLHRVFVSIDWKTRGRALNFVLHDFLRVDEELL